MEYMEFLKVRQPDNSAGLDAQKTKIYPRSLGQELVQSTAPKPRMLLVTASPAPKHPCSSKSVITPQKNNISGATSNRRINGDVTRSGVKIRRSKFYETGDCEELLNLRLEDIVKTGHSTSHLLNDPSLNDPSLNDPSLNSSSLNSPSLNNPSLNIASEAKKKSTKREAFCSVQSILSISEIQLTWWRILVWALSHRLVVLQDTIGEVFGNAYQRKIKADYSTGIIQVQVQSWWNMLSWAEGYKNSTIKCFCSVSEEMDSCWSSLKEVRSHCDIVERESSAKLPLGQAVAALSPSKSVQEYFQNKTSSTPHKFKDSFKGTKNSLASGRDAAAMSPSDIAGLAQEFSKYQGDRKYGYTNFNADVDNNCDCQLQSNSIYGMQVLSNNSIKRSEATIFLPTSMQDTFQNLQVKTSKYDSVDDKVKHRLEVLHNLKACCDTFTHQWESALHAGPHDAPVYFSTMLQALNGIYALLMSSQS